MDRSLLVMTDTPEDVLEQAVLYLRIYCLGIPFIIPYNFGAAILRSVGDTKRPLYSFETPIIVYLVPWALTGGMVVIYYIAQRKKLFATVI